MGNKQSFDYSGTRLLQPPHQPVVADPSNLYNSVDTRKKHEWSYPQSKTKYLKFDATEDPKDIWNVMTEIWQIKEPSVVFSLSGGHMPTKYQDAVEAVAAALKKITCQTGCWIISDGRNCGTSKCLRKVLQPESSKDCHRQQYSPVFVYASHWGSFHHKELLFGISEENSRVLNPYQDVYLLLDNGCDEAGDSAMRFRSKFEQFIKDTVLPKIYDLKGVSLPVVMLVIGGDNQTLNQVLDSVEQKNQVIVVNKSGDIPSVISELFYNLEDVYPRTSNEEAVLTKEEIFAFNSYIEMNDKKLRRIWNYAPAKDAQENIEMEKIKTTIREIMEKRYYVTVIDSSFENDDSLHSSILQRIYKDAGYTIRSGMAIALKTGNCDFIQALFLRDVDPLYSKEHDSIVRVLNDFYKDNLCSKQSIFKVLKLMCKRKSIIEKVDPEKSILPVIGRILHLLLGPRYKLMYQEAKYSDVTKYVPFEEKDELWHLFLWSVLVAKPDVKQFFLTQTPTPLDVTKYVPFEKKDELWHLFLWSVLAAKPDVTQFFLMQTPAPLGASLLAFKLYSKLAFYSSKFYEEKLKATLQSAADHFQKVAIEILDNMYNTDVDEAYRVLISELPFDLGSCVTPLLIADDAEAMDFMSHSCCQTYLQKVWKGNMAVETPFWKSIPFLTPFFVIPSIHFDGSPLKYLEKKRKKTKSDGAFEKLQSYYTAPVTKFYARMCSYLCFLGLLSYYVLTDLKPFSSFSEIAVSEWIVMFWELTLIVEEIVQLATVSDAGPTSRLENVKLNNTIWHPYEKLRMDLYMVELYLRCGRWNRMDPVIVMLFLVSFALRFALPLETFQMARIFFAVTVIFCYCRLLRFWYVLAKLGPRIIAIQMMFAELIKFLVVLAVFVVSFGVAFQAILNPNQIPSWSTFADILYRPYWEMFGEVFLDDDPGMGRPVSNLSCQAMAEKDSMHASGTRIYCYEWAAYVLLGIYLLISNVLLLNLLIAIFSKVYDDIHAKSHKVWRFNLYYLIQEFFYEEWLPPPLSILAHVYRCICSIVKRCKGGKLQKREDCFWLPDLPSSQDLQKEAIKGIKMYAKDG